MPGFFDLLRDAIAPAAEARAGYLQGQTAERQRERAERMQELALERQGYLDRLRANVDVSTIRRNNAQADRAERGYASGRDDYDQFVGDDGTLYLRNRHDAGDIRQAKVNGKPVRVKSGSASGEPLVRVQEDDGSFVWVPRSDAAGKKAASPSTSGPQARLDAKTALDEAIRGSPHPSKVPQQKLGEDPQHPGKTILVPNPAYTKAYDDSVAYDSSTVRPLRQHLLDVTVGSKVPVGPGTAPPAPKTASGNPLLSPAAPVAPRTPAATPTPAAPAAPRAPKLSAAQNAAMQAEFDDAAQKYKTLLSRGVDAATAQRAYDEATSGIAEKYGVAGGAP